MKSKLRSFTVQVSESDYEWMKQLADRTDSSISRIARRAIREFRGFLEDEPRIEGIQKTILEIEKMEEKLPGIKENAPTWSDLLKEASRSRTISPILQREMKSPKEEKKR